MRQQSGSWEHLRRGNALLIQIVALHTRPPQGDSATKIDVTATHHVWICFATLAYGGFPLDTSHRERSCGGAPAREFRFSQLNGRS
jgi:hypothetical protein